MDHLGEKIFPEFVRIYEQPFLQRALGSAAFDGEGVVRTLETLLPAEFLSDTYLDHTLLVALALKLLVMRVVYTT